MLDLNPLETVDPTPHRSRKRFDITRRASHKLVEFGLCESKESRILISSACSFIGADEKRKIMDDVREQQRVCS